MPYKSKAQLGFMHAKKPKIAKQWDEKYGGSYIKDLPEHVAAREKKPARVKGGTVHGKR